MQQPFLAMITPLGGGGQPPYPSQGPGFPTHPIVVPPGGAWPQPPYPSQGPGFPTNPIVVPPGGTWPDQPPVYPSQGPGFPTNPIQLPPWAGSPQPPWPQPPYPSQGPGFQHIRSSFRRGLAVRSRRSLRWGSGVDLGHPALPESGAGVPHQSDCHPKTTGA